MAQLERLRVYPVKGLDGIDLEAATVLEGGTLEFDREFALFDSDDEVLNGKRTDEVHDLRTDFDPASYELAIDPPASRRRRFDLASEREACARWLGEFFDEDLELRRDRSTGYVDRREMGPSVVSTATLETVASWFDELTVDGVRRRLRANVEVSGVPPFWEDRFVGEHAPTFEIGGVTFEGVTPCGRCVVPQRDPDTGEPLPDFRRRFIRKREETFPEWADRSAFDHFYTGMLIARVPDADRGRRLRIGDAISTNT
ncbi:MOSC domain-containing protein [Halomontanus rarus]|uniref:MOSC domain-containing protein n=1 Tax=Halomontanus rarus TaxID=3034020 RepID=UPI0023E850E9|nr:MOSC N-terminal beta barrel domain-containing protein [Halovivax sp. TS33]